MLAFYTQDEEQLDRLYRQSKLCQQKWIVRPDYRRRTIARALSSLGETYTTGDGARMVVGGNGNLVSRRPNLYRDGTRDTKQEVVRLAEVERPAPHTPNLAH